MNDRNREGSHGRTPTRGCVDSTAWIAHQAAMQARLADIGSLERQIAGLQAQQVTLTAAFIDDRMRFDDDHGFLSGPAQYRGLVAEVAIAKQISVSSAGIFMDDAWALSRHNPATLAALQTGQLGLTAARAIARETSVLDEPARSLVDQLLAEEAADLLPGQVRPVAEQRVAEIDPDAAIARADEERADKHVQLVPAGSGMAWLSAYLPAEQAAAAHAALHDQAKVLRAAGDPRTTGHLMCDSLVARLTGAATDAMPSQVNVMMTDLTLLGLTDDPAHLVGVGPMAAPHARALATNGHAWLRRFLTDPVDGSLTHGDPYRRRFDGALRDLVIARDQHCRGIRCSRRIRDIDHVTPYAQGGATTLVDGQSLDRCCHVSRDDPRMQVHRDGSTGVTTWTTPTGFTWRSLPPPSRAGALLVRGHPWRHHLIHPPASKLEGYLIEYAVRDLKQRGRSHARG